MGRKQLIVLGLRHAKQAKGAKLVAVKKLHTGAHKAAAHKAAAQPSTAQLPKNAVRQTEPNPSFAASAVKASAAALPAAPASTLVGRVFGKLRPVTVEQAHAPSFAAAPVVGQGQEGAAKATPRPNAVLAAAERLVAQQLAKTQSAAAAGRRAAARNPLYRFAKLGKDEAGAAVAASAAEKENLGPLKKYAELPQGPARGPALAPATPLKRASQLAADAKALLRYAKLK